MSAHYRALGKPCPLQGKCGGCRCWECEQSRIPDLVAKGATEVQAAIIAAMTEKQRAHRIGILFARPVVSIKPGFKT